MSIAAQVARRYFWLRLLRASLVAGAVYDLGFAALLVAAPEVPARWLALPVPHERFYLWLIAVFLAMVSATYLFAAHDPRRYSPLVGIAIGGRVAGAIVLAVGALSDPALSGLYLLCAADLLFAISHAATFPGARG